jgi:hypothetical protein
MSLRTRLSRYNPARIVRTIDVIPDLREFVQRSKQTRKETDRHLQAVDRRLKAIEESLAAHEKALDVLPGLEARMDQFMTAYRTDIKYAARVAALSTKLDASRVKAHVRAAVERTTLELDPFPHIVVDDFLPEDVYAELVSAMPDTVFFKRENMSRQEMQVPFIFAPVYGQTVWDFFYEDAIEQALLPGLVAKFEPALDTFVRRYWPALGRWADAGIPLEVTNSRLLLRRPGYEIKPHRDPRWAFFTSLIYLQKPGVTHQYGTQLYRMKQEREATHNSPFWVGYDECELVKDVPAGRNRVLVFLNGTGVHAASVPTDAPANLERYVYQVQMGPGAAARQRLIQALPPDLRPAWETARDRDY